MDVNGYKRRIQEGHKKSHIAKGQIEEAGHNANQKIYFIYIKSKRLNPFILTCNTNPIL